MGLVFAIVASPLASADVSRPVEGEGPTQVQVAVFVIDVDEINSASQRFDANVYLEYRWQDQRLAHSGPNEVSRSKLEVWHPRIQLVNQQKAWPTFPEIVEITPHGEVVYRQRVWGSFSQPLQLHDFPFDRHVFTIQLAAAGYNPDEVELVPNPDMASGIARHLSLADWDILGSQAESRVFVFRPEGEGTPGFVFSFEARRQIGYYIAKVIVPLILIVAMSWVVFWIDPAQSGTQISVAVTAMLTLIAYRFAIGTNLPKVSYLTRLDYLILLSTMLVFASLVEVVCTSTLAKKEQLQRARAIDRWSRWLFPATFALIAVTTLGLGAGP